MNLNNSIVGRWLTPDPAGLGAVDPTNPQSWNHYAYALNNPTTLTDPSGLDPGLGGGIGECPFFGCVPNCSIFTCGPMPGQREGSGGGGGGAPAPKPARPSLIPTGTQTPPGPPYVCSATAKFLNSLDFTFKLGLEVEVGPAKIGFALFKNNNTGETGSELGVSLPIITAQVTSAGVNSVVPNPQPVVALGPFQYNFATGNSSVAWGSLLKLGAVAGVGAEVSFNQQRYNQYTAQCGGAGQQ